MNKKFLTKNSGGMEIAIIIIVIIGAFLLAGGQFLFKGSQKPTMSTTPGGNPFPTATISADWKVTTRQVSCVRPGVASVEVGIFAPQRGYFTLETSQGIVRTDPFTNIPQQPYIYELSNTNGFNASWSVKLYEQPDGTTTNGTLKVTQAGNPINCP